MATDIIYIEIHERFSTHARWFTFKENFIRTKKFPSYCCGATEGSEQQHNQDLKEIYKGRRILEFITFDQNALHLTRVHCATNNSNKNTGKFGG